MLVALEDEIEVRLKSNTSAMVPQIEVKSSC